MTPQVTPELRAATLGAPVPAPTSNLGASMYNEISQRGAINRSLPLTNALAGQSLNSAQITVDAQKKAAAEAAQRAKEMADPRNYQAVRKSDGGYDFYDPAGNPINISQYAKVTGSKPSEILKDSENPLDQQYVQDYNNLQDLIQAVHNNDTDTIQAYKDYTEANGLPDITKMTPAQLATMFRQYYQRYYTDNSGEGANNGIVIPNAGVVSRSAGASNGTPGS